MRLESHHTDRPLSNRALAIIGMIILTILVLLQATHREPMGPKCPAEDEVLVKVDRPAFDLDRNSLHCIHIDNFEGRG